jgi:hypothetical protein
MAEKHIYEKRTPRWCEKEMYGDFLCIWTPQYSDLIIHSKEMKQQYIDTGKIYVSKPPRKGSYDGEFICIIFNGLQYTVNHIVDGKAAPISGLFDDYKKAANRLFETYCAMIAPETKNEWCHTTKKEVAYIYKRISDVIDSYPEQ